MYDRILVPTDGSEHAERAARYALALARAYDADLHVVNVVDARKYSSTSAEMGDVGTEQREQFEREGREAIEAVEELVGGDVPVVGELVAGAPHEAILDYADENDVDLVVMGTHGRTGLDRLLVGSTTERVLRLSDVPVFTVGPDASDPADGFRNVLVPTDGSSGVEPAVAAALDLAETYDATIHALHIVDVRSFVSGDEEGYATGVPEDALDALEERGETATERIAERAAERDLRAETAVVDGIPAGSILEYAETNDVDLVVIGTHGRTGLEHLLLGSVAERVVRRADCPVLTVRRADEED